MPASVSTWTSFTSSDLALAVIGIVGITSVFIVLATASRNTNRRELILRKNAQSQSNASDS